LRISNADRGGIWLAGKRLNFGSIGIKNYISDNIEEINSSSTANRMIFAVIDKCSTFNDMIEVFDDI
jgi:hypothetical protein